MLCCVFRASDSLTLFWIVTCGRKPALVRIGEPRPPFGRKLLAQRAELRRAERQRDAALQRLRLAHVDLERPPARDDLAQQRLDLAGAVARQSVEERDVRRDKIALRRIVPAAQRVEAGEGFPVHLQREDERRRA